MSTVTAYLACYKYRPPRDAAWRVRWRYASDWLIRAFTRSPYSHCEIAVPVRGLSGVYECYSSFAADGGVRCKQMVLDGEYWDLLPLTLDYGRLLTLFRETEGRRYDYIGILRFILPFLPPAHSRWYCSEWCAAALGYDDRRQWTPGQLAEAVRNH